MHVGLLLNPNAKRMRRDPDLAERLTARLAGRGPVVCTRSAEEIPEALERLRREGVELLALCGGDGTTLAVLSHLDRLWQPAPRIALLGGGTFNTIPRALGLTARPEPALRRLLDPSRATLRTFPAATIRVNDQVGFIFGAAMAAGFFDAYYDHAAPGFGPAVRLALRLIHASLTGGALARRIFSPLEARVTVDGLPVPFDQFTLIVAATIDHVGLGMRPTYRGRDSLEHFHLVATGHSPLHLARQVHRVVAGLPLLGDQNADHLAGQVELTAHRPFSYIVDGERFVSDHVRLQRGPVFELVG